jgi:hypothetical protein
VIGAGFIAAVHARSARLAGARSGRIVDAVLASAEAGGWVDVEPALSRRT